VPSIYGVCSLIGSREMRSWQDERPWCNDEFSAHFDKSRPSSLHTAVTDTKNTLSRSLASSLQNDLYLALAHDIGDEVARVQSLSTMNPQSRAVAVISSKGEDLLPP
jgi:hypothetical protein